MARLFWVGVGAIAAVVAVHKGRQAVRKYLPEEIATRAQERAGVGKERLLTAVAEFKKGFGEAQARREQELRDALLASGQRVATSHRLERGWDPSGLITMGSNKESATTNNDVVVTTD